MPRETAVLWNFDPANVGSGSCASPSYTRDACGTTAMPPIATELVLRNEPSLCANSGHFHQLKSPAGVDAGLRVQGAALGRELINISALQPARNAFRSLGRLNFLTIRARGLADIVACREKTLTVVCHRGNNDFESPYAH